MQSRALRRAAGDPWSATTLRAHLEGLWTPNPQGFPSVTELGCFWDAVLAPATLQGSHRARDTSRCVTQGLLISVRTRKGVSDHCRFIQHLPEQGSAKGKGVLYLKQNKGALQAHKQFNFVTLFQTRARWRQNISLILKTSSEKKSWCPARPTPRHISSHAICKGICNPSLRCLQYSVFCSLQTKCGMMKTHEAWWCQKKSCTTINCYTSTSDLSRAVTCKA